MADRPSLPADRPAPGDEETGPRQLPAVAPSLASAPSKLLGLDELDPEALRELISTRAGHGKKRVLSTLAMAVMAIGLLRSGAAVPGWGLILLYGVPLTVVLGTDAFLVWRLSRRARALGLSPEGFRELRERLKRAGAAGAAVDGR